MLWQPQCGCLCFILINNMSIMSRLAATAITACKASARRFLPGTRLPRPGRFQNYHQHQHPDNNNTTNNNTCSTTSAIIIITRLPAIWTLGEFTQGSPKFLFLLLTRIAQPSMSGNCNFNFPNSRFLSRQMSFYPQKYPTLCLQISSFSLKSKISICTRTSIIEEGQIKVCEMAYRCQVEC